ncbi:hypothetical protein CRUP_029855 [Coryphaenoides rupestris]|nr:hypothetical protein CRUP_029855 [Coryphaenoides rupestris]
MALWTQSHVQIFDTPANFSRDLGACVEEEIQQLKQRLEKVEKERNELRLNSDRLESRSKFDSVNKQMESMEMEVMEARLIRASELNGEMDEDDTGGEWRLKYERAIREIEFTKKRLQQEFDDTLEVEQQNKRHEQSVAQEEVQRERSQKEKLARERDVLTGEVLGLRQQLEDLELCAVNLKLEHLDADMQDLNSQESRTNPLAKVRKQIRDIEAKAKDQEEELDEQGREPIQNAGTR